MDYIGAMIRLFIAEPTAQFAARLRLVLALDQGRYLTQVMRRGVGDEVSLFNGRDGEWTARLAEAGKKAVVLELDRQTRPQPSGQGPVLVVAVVKRAPLEYIVEKATELGASRIQLLTTRRTRGDHVRLDRLAAIARESAEQTERLDVPEILAPVSFDAFLAAPGAETLIFADEETTHETARDGAVAALSGVKGHAAIVIGPEGGFDDNERAALRARPDVTRINLGPRILRADTAAICALTLYQVAAGDWRETHGEK